MQKKNGIATPHWLPGPKQNYNQELVPDFPYWQPSWPTQGGQAL